MSIAHDDGLVVVAAGRSGGPRVGVDVEQLTSFTADEAAVVLGPGDSAMDPLVGFVIKEAVYKSWSQPSRAVLDFGAIRLRLGGTGFEAVVDDPGEGGGARVFGRWCVAGGRAPWGHRSMRGFSAGRAKRYPWP